MPHIPPCKLTEGFVKALKLPSGEEKPYVVRDKKVTGLMVMVNKHRKTYAIQRDLWQGQSGSRRKLMKTVRRRIGFTDELRLEEARLKAEDIIRLIKRGIDPNVPQAEQKAEGWTVDILFDEYARDLHKRECSETTIENTLARR